MPQQVRIGWRAYVSPASSGTDADAATFISAAGITDATQTSAINALVSDLKAYGLWTKMKAIYPFVGGSAASHKFNLKDPRDLDAAYRLVFNGGGTHSSNGYQPNGTTGYADTKLVPSSSLTLNSTHISYYSRTQTTDDGKTEIGCSSNTNELPIIQMYIRRSNAIYSDHYDYINNRIIVANTNTTGLFFATRTANTSHKVYRNGSLMGTDGNTSTQSSLPSFNMTLGAYNYHNGIGRYSTKESAFASIGDGLTDAEAANFYTAVQKFQTTLGRHVGTPYVSDPDAIAFLMAAGITDGTQAAAINTLVITMKANGVWTKMKAIYPFVGGSAASHKWNLKDPRDLDTAFRLVFNGGWTHTSTGALPNGSNGYADTKISPSSILQSNYNHLSYYSRTSTVGNLQRDIAAFDSGINPDICIGTNTGVYLSDSSNYNVNRLTVNISDASGLFIGTRILNNNHKIYRNGSQIGNTDTYVELNRQLPTNLLYIGAANCSPFGINSYSTKEVSFASIGDGLTNTEATVLYNVIQAYQTTLGRQINVPLVSDTDAQTFLNAANITSFQQASAVNKLVVDLKSAGIWTKMKAIYPFVGGSAASHKWNLKDPRDLDAAYRLVFNGGWTHTSTGALPNGTTGYADTKLSPISVLTSSNHFSFYNNGSISNAQTTIDIGAGNGDPNAAELYLWTYREDNTMKYDNGSSVTNRVSSPTTSKGFSLGTRTSNTVQKIYKNGNLLATNSNVNVNPLPYPNIYIGSGNINGTSLYPSSKQTSFVTIGDGLTDAEATAFYTAVQTYQTSLGRQIDTPVYNNGLVLNLDAGNANSYPGSGTTWFDLAAGNNGTLVNGPTYDVNNGGSILFNGTNKYTDISYTKINITNKLTISTWVYFLSQPSTIGNPNIVDKWDWPNNKRSFSIGTENGYLSTSISYDGLFDNRIGCSDNSSIVLNQWINISMTYDGRNLKLYKNGSLIQSSSFSQDRNIFSDITTNIFLGRSRGTEGSSRHLNARISVVQIYSNSFTATEILNNYNSTRGRFGL